MQYDLKTKGSVIVMKYDEYLNACLKFAKDTENWDAENWSWLDRSRWFTTNGGGGYEESCDNANGGIDVAWAYKMDPDKVRKYAPQEFMDCCVEFLDMALNDPSAANDFVKMAYDLFS